MRYYRRRWIVLLLRLRLQQAFTSKWFPFYRVHIPSEQYAICYEFTWSSNFVDRFYLLISTSSFLNEETHGQLLSHLERASMFSRSCTNRVLYTCINNEARPRRNENDVSSLPSMLFHLRETETLVDETCSVNFNVQSKKKSKIK